MPATLCRLTVWGPRRRLDLALPTAVPIAELVPILVAADAGDDDEVRGDGSDLRPWIVTTVRGDVLAPDFTLADQRVLDGDHLLLTRADDERPGVLGSDVIETIAVASDGTRGRWTPAATAHAQLAVLAVGLAGLAVALFVERARTGAPVAAGVSAVLVAAAAWFLSSRQPGAGAVVAVAGTPVFGATAAALAPGAGAAGTVAVTAAGVFVGALVAAAAAIGARAPARALAALSVAAAIAGGAALEWAPVSVAAVVVLVAVAAVSALPAVALRVAGLGPATLAAGAETQAAVARRARVQLAWLLGADGALALGSVAVLGASSEAWAIALAAVAGVVLVLRARAFRFAAEIVPLVAAGTAAVAAALAAIAVEAHGHGHWVTGVVAVGVVVLALIVPLFLAGQVEPAVLQTNLTRLETVAALALVPVTAGALGVYTAVADAASRLR